MSRHYENEWMDRDKSFIGIKGILLLFIVIIIVSNIVSFRCRQFSLYFINYCIYYTEFGVHYTEDLLRGERTTFEYEPLNFFSINSKTMSTKDTFKEITSNVVNKYNKTVSAEDAINKVTESISGKSAQEIESMINKGKW